MISIHIEANSADEARVEMQRLLGVSGPAADTGPVPGVYSERQTAPADEQSDGPVPGSYSPAEEEEPEGRKYGQPSDGKARRTKAEMAEDEEIEKLAASMNVDLSKAEIAGAPVAEAMLQSLKHEAYERERDTRETGRSITDNPEDRKEPEPDDKPLDGEIVDEDEKTRDDMKAAMQRFVEKHGMDVAMERLPEIMGYPKQSDVPEDPALFAKIIGKIDEAL